MADPTTSSSGRTPSAEVEVAMDRFVSASSGQDAVSSLEALLAMMNDSASTSTGGSTTSSMSWMIWQHEQMAESLVHLLQAQELKSTSANANASNTEEGIVMMDDDAVRLVLQLYQQHLAKDVQALLQPAPSRLLEALLDVMDRNKSSSSSTSTSTSTSTTTYTRVLALQVLEQLSKLHTKVANPQWLEAPNGLHRLADVLTNYYEQDQEHQDPLEEAVRTQALPLAMQLASTSPAMAQIWVLACDLETKLLEMTWHVYGGLTKGNPLVVEMLQLVQVLVEQTSSSSSSTNSGSTAIQELVWQRPAVPMRLAQLLDLRGGDEFLHPQDYVGKKKKKKPTTSSSKTTNNNKKKKKLGPLSSSRSNMDEDDEEDDLDALLQTTTTTTTGTSTAAGSKKPSSDSNDSQVQQQQDYPCLLESEEKVISTVLHIVNALLQDDNNNNNNNDDLKRKVWSEYAPGMCSLIWELALQTPPPPGTTANTTTFFLAFPSCTLQQQALELIATRLADPVTMDRHNGLDRLLEKVCTGGGGGSAGGDTLITLDEKLGISQAALAVLRSILDANRIHEILLHTLAPPPTPIMDDDDGGGGAQEPPVVPGPTVVQKLWNTVAGNLLVVPNNSATTTDSTAPAVVSDDQRTLFLSGALGGLAVFLADEESREMVFRAAPPEASLDHMLEVLLAEEEGEEKSSSSSTSNDNINMNKNVVVWSLYRFLCEYIYQTPRIVQTLLSSPASTHLATLATAPTTTKAKAKSASSSITSTKPLAYLLLGLCMEFFPTNATEAECGGWTPGSILELIQTIGIPKVTKALEGFKKVQQQQQQQQQQVAVGLPWTKCELEAKHWSQWYQKAVWVVRKRIVKELAGTSAVDHDDDEDDDTNRVAMVDGQEALLAGGGTSATSGGGTSSSSNSNKIKPLQRMLSQQTTELEELRVQLEQAQSKIASQEHQLETWQRRLKSNPTELDGMLSELTTKTATLEEEISALQNEKKHSEEKHEQAVAAMNRKLEEQRDEATKLRLSEQEAQEDRDRMEQELQALSQAYSSLEEEYQRSSSSSGAATEGGAPTGEAAASSHQQAQGEASTPGGSTEVSTLRAENARLRQDARAADEWMAMAVQRMNDMGAHTAQLQQEIATLKQQAQQTASASQNDQSPRQEMDRLQHQVASLQEQVRQEQSQVTSLRESLQVAEAQKATDIQLAVAAAQQDTSRSVTIDPNQAAEMQRLQNELATKRSEIQSLQVALEEARLVPSSATVPPVAASTTSSDEETTQQLVAARKELEESHRHSELEIYKKESIIRELENRLGSGLGPYKLDDIRERDQEIEELRAANESAQEWMAKAVEHHQLLQEKVATLTEEKAALAHQHGQVANPSIVNDAAVTLLEERVAELESEKTALEEKISAMEATIESYESSAKEAREEVQTLTRSLEETRTEFSDYRNDSEAKVGQWTERVVALENQLSEREAKLQESQQDLEDATARIGEFESWAELAQGKIAQMLSDKEEADKLIQAKEAEIMTLINSGSTARPEESDADRNIIDQLRTEKEDAIAAKDEFLSELEELRLQLAAKEKAGKSASAEAAVQSVFDVPQTDAADFFGGGSVEVAASTLQKSLRDDDFTDHASEILRLKEELKSANETIQSDQDVVRQWEDKVAELEANIQSLTAQIQEEQEEANRVISQWQESCDAADEKCRELEARLDETNQATDVSSPANAEETSQPTDEEGFDQAGEILRLTEELKAANETIESDQDVVRQWEDRVTELEANIHSLTAQIQEEQEEANRVISQWQESCDAADEKCRELEARLDETNRATGETTESSSIERVLRETEDKLRSANEALAEAEDVVKQWEDRCNELEGELSSLTAQLEESNQNLRNEKLASEHQSQDFALKAEHQNQDLALQAEHQNQNLVLKLSNLEVEKAALETSLTETRNEFLDFRNESEMVVGQWTERVDELEKQIEELVAQLGQQEAAANEVIAQWEAKAEELEKDMRISDDGARQWKERADELENEERTLRAQLEANPTGEAREALQEKLDLLEKRCVQMEESYENLRDEKLDAERHARELVSKMSIMEERINQIEHEKQALEEKMVPALTESDMVERLEEELAVERGRHHEAREEVEALTSSLEEIKTELSEFKIESEEVVGQWTERVDQLENEVSELGAQLGQQEAEANEVIARWESKAEELENEIQTAEDAIERWRERAHELENEVGSLRAKVDQSRGTPDETERALQDQLNVIEERCRLLEEDCDISRNEKNEAEHLVQELSAKASLLEERVSQLEDERAILEAKFTARAESDDAERLEEELAVERGRHREAREEIQTLTRSLEETRTEFSDFRNESETVVGQWTERVDELENQISELEAQLGEQESDANEAIARWEVKAEELDEEARILQERLAEAKDDLRHSNEGLKFANERLADAEGGAVRWQQRTEELENELRSLRAQIEDGQDEVRRWEERAKELEGEVASLRAQLEESRGGALHETSDMELRKSLLRSLEEIESARAAEKEANERLAKLRLQASVGEQEIISAKSEINFLTEAMDELRMHEESKRASLEYRIGSLEDENDVLRRYHSSELETVRNELAQMSMEKDRILHQLKESEKTNAALVFAASKAETQGAEDSTNIDPEAEISKLRIENAYLLTVAADDKARAERRLREMLAAHRASVETDTILEHELRLSAESTIQSLKAQLDEYKNIRVR